MTIPWSKLKSANQQENLEGDIKDETVKCLRTAACSPSLNMSDGLWKKIMEDTVISTEVYSICPFYMHRGPQCSQGSSSHSFHISLKMDLCVFTHYASLQSFFYGVDNWVYKEKTEHLESSTTIHYPPCTIQ